MTAFTTTSKSILRHWRVNEHCLRQLHCSTASHTQERYQEPKPWSNAYQQRNDTQHQPADTPSSSKDIKSDLVSKYNLLNPRGRQPLSKAIEQDADLLNESRIRNFNAVNEREYNEANDAAVAAEEQENAGIVAALNTVPEIQREIVDFGLPKRSGPSFNKAIMPKNRRSVENYTQQQSIGKLTELQLSRLCILHKYNSTVYSIERLARMFQVDAKMLHVVLKHISIPYIYKDDNATYGAHTVNPAKTNIEQIKVAGIDSVLTDGQRAMLTEVQMDDPRNLNSVFESITSQHKQTAT